MRLKYLVASAIALILLVSLAFSALACPTPVVNSISPAQGNNSETISVTINGDKFHKSAGVKLTKIGEPDIIATDVKLISKTQITCTLDLKGKSVGKWDVIVYNVGSMSKKEKVATLAGAFTITYKAPAITAIIPKMGYKDAVVSVSITGNYFNNGAKVVLSAPGQAEISATKVKVVSGTQITCDFNLAGATPGIYDVKVTNPDGQSGSLAKAFAVDTQTPSVKMIIPNKGVNNGPVTVVLTGENFDKKASTKLAKPGKEISGTDVNVVSNSNLSCTFDLNQKEVGIYDVIVTNPDGKSGILAEAFTIEKIMEEKLLKSIFFDFDKYNIRDDQVSRLDYNLDLLKEFKNYYVVLDGHADERGTREYNVALAGRRANTIKKFLVENGFDPNKITINAYGEDYPVKKGHNESSWWYNRRVDISIWETNPASWANRSQSIYFANKAADFDAVQRARIDQSIAILKDNPGSFVILVATTKDYNTDQENLTLAQKRLDAVKAYLLKAGISEDQISTIDNGKIYPFFSGAVDNKVAVDSRVDLLVIEF